jgi:GntR family transcriptional regulator
MEPLLESWKLEFHSGIPVYKQIVHHVQAAISSGQLKEGDRLPTIRALHEALGVNPNTVAKAYRELAQLGQISAEHGSGCYVAPVQAPPRLTPQQQKTKAEELGARFAAEARSHGIALDLLIQQLTHQKSHA